MASDKLGQQIHAGLNQQPQLVFPDTFGCGPLRLSAAAVGDTGSTKAATRELTASFLDHRHFFQPQPQAQAAEFRHQWNANSRSSGGDSSEADDEDDDDDEDKEEEEGETNLANVVTVAKISGRNQNETYSSNQKMKHLSLLGFKEGNVGQSVNERNNGHNSSGEVVANARGGEIYYLQYLNGAEGPSSSSRQKEMAVENECGFSGKKEGSYYSDSGDPLRAIFSDPITGILMDDAMILPCGHSFGSGGIQHIIRTKTCYTCSRPVSEDCIAPNLSLRLAVQAFRREEELQVNRKRRRERYDRDKGTYDSIFTDHPRTRGVQFPFAVTDRVIIKVLRSKSKLYAHLIHYGESLTRILTQGNKRTPPRFVGREAIVTTQCLNGWYVVKTLDNAESVKLQYRSLAKVTENPSAKP